MSSCKKRNVQLDVLRGIAILLVMGRHLEIPRPGGAIGALADAWFTIGWLGVDLFFVLSGFLIGGLLLMELDKHNTIAVSRFLIRRGLKIYPLYIVFIGYLVAMPMAKAMIGGGDVWAALSNRLSTLWPNLLFRNNYIGTNPEGHTWSLAVEEHFYLTLPFVLVLLARKGLIRLLIPICLSSIVVCLALRCASVWSNDSFAATVSATHLRIDALLSGVAIRALAQYYPDKFMSLRQWRGALVVVGLFLWSQNFFYETSTAFFRTVGLTGTNLGAAAFLLAAYHTQGSDFGRWSNLILEGYVASGMDRVVFLRNLSVARNRHRDTDPRIRGTVHRMGRRYDTAGVAGEFAGDWRRRDHRGRGFEQGGGVACAANAGPVFPITNWNAAPGHTGCPGGRRDGTFGIGAGRVTAYALAEGMR